MLIKKIILSVLGIGYVLCPYDLLPDFFIGRGWIDDLIIIWLLWRYVFSARAKGSNTGSQGAGRRAGESFQENAQARSEDESQDPFQILGLAPGASEDEIRQAYRRLANMYHPDKVLHLGDEFQRLAEHKFKRIQHAYQVLMEKRGR